MINQLLRIRHQFAIQVQVAFRFSSMNRLSLIQKHVISSSVDSLGLTKVKISKQADKAVGYITLNSPKDLNALSIQMQKDITVALNHLQEDNDIKCIVIQSQHPKIFCAGANIKQFQNQTMEQMLIKEIFTVIEDGFRNIRKPVIAAVNGKSLGGGFQLALLCDIIVCSEKAYFGLPQINLGLIPGIGGTQRSAKVLGQKLVMRMVLSGQGLTGQQAGDLGLAELIKQPKKFEEQVRRLAETIASKSMSALIVGKRAVKQSSNMTLTQGLQFERATFYPLLQTKGANQGISAFVQKRKANFKGI